MGFKDLTTGAPLLSQFLTYDGIFPGAWEGADPAAIERGGARGRASRGHAHDAPRAAHWAKAAHGAQARRPTGAAGASVSPTAIPAPNHCTAAWPGRAHLLAWLCGLSSHPP